MNLAGLLLDRLPTLVALLLSLSVHEYAHARAARAMGDDTARAQGRETLDPTAHIDPLGLMLPLVGVPFGWAKPVPVNVLRLRADWSGRGAMMVVAAAGPASNAFLAVWTWALSVAIDLEGRHWLSASLLDVASMNLALAVFNLLPIPPLDGSRVVDALIPASLRPYWERLGTAGAITLLVGGAVVYVVLQSMWFALQSY